MNELQPGETVHLVKFENVQTPVGVIRRETLFPLSYEQIMELVSEVKAPVSRRSKTAGSYFSRVASLALYALENGRYTNGQPALNTYEIIGKLVDSFNELTRDDYADIGEKVLNRLEAAAKLTNITTRQSDLLTNVYNQITEA